MSVYAQTRAVGNVADDAEFRIWGKFISDSLTSAGWAKTADTGQVDWATVTKPIAANTVAGYEIRKSPTKAGFVDLYIKIEFGTGAAATYVSIWMTLGNGSDGAGALTGVVGTRDVIPGNNMAADTEDLVSAADDRLAILTVPTGAVTTNGFFVVVERLTDPDGAYIADGWVMQNFGTNNAFTQSLDSAGVFTSALTTVMGYVPPSYAGSGGVIMVATAMPNTPAAQYPMLALLFVPIAHSGAGVTHSIALFPGAVAKTYRGTYIQMSAAYTNITPPSNMSPLVLWE